MHPTQAKLIGIAVTTLVVFILGYWLHYLDKPYPGSLLTAHKVISLALAYVVIRWMVELFKLTSLPQEVLLLSMLAALCFVITVLTGGFLSMEKEWPNWIGTLHHLGPYVTVTLLAWDLYLILTKHAPPAGA